MRGETGVTTNQQMIEAISIHSPHARGDPMCTQRTSLSAISIHSPHARGDNTIVIHSPNSRHFNPLPSCEGRHKYLRYTQVHFLFQSTPLMRGETARTMRKLNQKEIFQSTPLMRGETCFGLKPCRKGLFQSTPLMRGETLAG